MSIRFPLTCVKSIANTRTTAGRDTYDFLLPQDIDSVVVKFYSTDFNGTSEQLDCFVQTSDDGGATWYDCCNLQIVAATTKPNALWATIPVAGGSGNSHNSVIGNCVSSTITAQQQTGLPILGKEMRIGIVVAGTQVTNTDTVVKVYANSQSSAS